MVAHHTIVFFAPQAPDGQEPLHLGLLYQRTYHSINTVGHNDGVEGVSGAVGIPAREGRIKLARLGLHNLVGSVAIHSINVGNLVGLNEGVVERGIIVFLLVEGALYINALQVGVPFVVSGAARGSKVPVRHFGSQVLLGAINAGGRHGNLHQQLLALVNAFKGGHNAVALLGVGSFGQGDVAGHGAVKLQYEEIVLLHPHRVLHMAHQRLCIFPMGFAKVHLRVILLLVPGWAVLQVDEH